MSIATQILDLFLTLVGAWYLGKTVSDWCVARFDKWCEKRRNETVMELASKPDDKPKTGELDVWVQDSHTMESLLKALGRPHDIVGEIIPCIYGGEAAFAIPIRTKKDIDAYMLFVAKARVTNKLVARHDLNPKNGRDVVFLEVKE